MKEFIVLNRKISDLKSRLETVLDASSNGIVALDPEENVVFMNKNSETFLFPGKSISVGDNITDFIKNTNLIAFL
ncbi:MAG: PAS domain-containing protein [Desulfitobacteriaceae bacterium]